MWWLVGRVHAHTDRVNVKGNRNYLMRTINPVTGDILKVSRHPFLWTLLFGPFYFAAKGVWKHAALSSVLAICTFGVSWLVYPFYARRIFRNRRVDLMSEQIKTMRAPPAP